MSMAPIYGVEYRWRDRKYRHWSPWDRIEGTESTSMTGAWRRVRRWDFRLGSWVGKKVVGLEQEFRVVVDVHELGDEGLS